nr:reverse transcriptase domain-containing protein [Tanacetum cinerariifolium]
VRGVTFRHGDFVYRSNDASHAVDGGKLGPKWEGPYEVTEALGDGAYMQRSMDRMTISPGKAQATYYVVPYKILHLTAGDCRHGFRLYPLRKIVHSDYQKLTFLGPFGKGPAMSIPHL